MFKGKELLTKKELDFKKVLVSSLKTFDAKLEGARFKKDGYKVGIVFKDYYSLFGNKLVDYVEGANFNMYEDYASSFRKDFKVKYVKVIENDDLEEVEMTPTREKYFSDMFLSCLDGFSEVERNFEYKITKPNLDNLYYVTEGDLKRGKIYFYNGKKLSHLLEEGSASIPLRPLSASEESFDTDILNSIKKITSDRRSRVFELTNNYEPTELIEGQNNNLTDCLLLSVNGKPTIIGKLHIKLESVGVFNVSHQYKSDLVKLPITNPTFNVPLLNSKSALYPKVSDVTKLRLREWSSRVGVTPESLFGDRTSLFFIKYLRIETSKLSEKTILIHRYVKITPQEKYVVDGDGRYAYLHEMKELGLMDLIGYKMFEKNGYKFYKFKDNAETNIDKRMHRLEEVQRVMGYGRSLQQLLFVDTDGESTHPKNKLYLGPEFEFDEGGQKDKNAEMFLSALTSYNPYAWVTRDGSLNSGFEGKTQPSTLEAHMSPEIYDYRLAFGVLKKLGYSGFSNDTCGLHVHVNKSFFGVRQGERSSYEVLGILATILEKNWDYVSAFSRRVRITSLQQWAPNRGGLPTILECVENGEIKNSVAKNALTQMAMDKYRSRSAVHGEKPETFEFRIFKGTLDYDSYMATLQFVSNVCHIAKNIKEAFDSEVENVLTRLLSITFKEIVEYKHYDELSKVALDLKGHYKD